MKLRRTTMLTFVISVATSATSALPLLGCWRLYGLETQPIGSVVLRVV